MAASPVDPSLAETIERAIAESEHYFKKASGLSGFHPSYPPLCTRLWLETSENHSYFSKIEQCEKFATDMVRNNWSDWAPNNKDRKTWSRILEANGLIEVGTFLRCAEDEEFDVEKFLLASSAVITQAHTAWKEQGGSDPASPPTGPGSFQTIDWSKPRDQVRAEIGEALKRDGFFLLKNHGIPHEKVSSALFNARHFFAMRGKVRREEQQRIEMKFHARPMMKCARGFSPMRTEALNVRQGPDEKETFDFSLQKEGPGGIAPPTSSDASCRSKMHLGENMWPTEDQGQMAPTGFRIRCEEYQDLVFKLSMELLEIVCESAGLSKEQINSDILPMFENPLVVSRLIRYPTAPKTVNPFMSPQGPVYAAQPFPAAARLAQPQSEQPLAMGAGSHVDYGALTLIAEDCPGLEVQRRGAHNNPWEEVPHEEGAFVVNTGYVLEKLTNGLLPATRHRVQNRNAVDRHALALFLDPHPDSIVGPLPKMVKAGEAPKYDKCVAGHKGVRFGNPKYLERAAARA